jgi:cytoskeletal protein RodZ
MLHVGERLSEERIKIGYTLEEVSKATKIRVSFLQAIEKGEYKKLPAGTYAHGFVRNYAKFLKLPDYEILAIFKREYDEEKFIKVLPEGLARNEDFPLYRIKFAQALKVLPLILIALLIYIVFQYRSAIFNPPLDVSYPLENSTVASQTVSVIGKTDPNATVFVNSGLAVLDKNGNFQKTVRVFPGSVVITVKSVNNFNKTTILERHIQVKI